MTRNELKNIPDYILHDLMMGTGALYIKGKEIVVIVSTYSKKLPCGCPGGQHIRFQNSKGKACVEYLDHLDDSYHYKTTFFLQGKEWEPVWQELYQREPWRKPIIMNNSI